ncbi:uncharacterized protein LOC115702274 [Cannabis sativa]|uniref:uncharacterized protein LOC115702274 n=1 Tax=Cannabis sativa TaxID=3483 RepID=UPI0029C9E02A|nr:uncharacterized protein LOC115702274 [Cannabis sativa]
MKSVRAEGMKALFLKLMRLKHKLKKFNKKAIGDIGKGYQAAKTQYLEARMEAQMHMHDLNFQLREKEAAAYFHDQEHMYHSFLKQQSKVNWLCKGDENNDFFHAFLKKRRMENNIVSYTNDHGDIIEKFPEVEIRKAFFSIPDSKAPGPDGYGAGFFKKMWADLGTDFIKAIENFFNNWVMPKELHATMITLIPKIENPTKAVDYRPIACCSTNQGALVQGRLIAHNIMILQDILKNYNRKNVSPRCTIKVDISKAYDTVNWDFLEDLLNAYNLLARFIKWIMTCVRATYYSILMNGRVQGNFKGKKGLRQGDPLSPLLFVLIMEFLTRKLQMAAKKSDYRFHPMWEYAISPGYKEVSGGVQRYLGACYKYRKSATNSFSSSWASELLDEYSIWSYDLKTDTSWYWKKICHVRDKFSRSDIVNAGANGKFKTILLYNSKLPQKEQATHDPYGYLSCCDIECVD